MPRAGMKHFVFLCGLTHRTDLNGRLATLDKGVWRGEGRAAVYPIDEQAVPNILRRLVETGYHLSSCIQDAAWAAREREPKIVKMCNIRYFDLEAWLKDSRLACTAMLSFLQAAERRRRMESPRIARRARENMEECQAYIADGTDEHALGRCEDVLGGRGSDPPSGCKRAAEC